MAAVVIDANVVVSALLAKDPNSPPARVLRLARSGALSVLLSVDLIAEWREVLLRERLQRQHRKTRDEIDSVLMELVNAARVVEPPDSPDEGPDPGDAHLWRLLRTQPGAILITGDRALLENPPPWASVMTPRAWIDLWRSEE